VRSDSAGASTRLAWHLREREVAFTLGMPIDAHVREAILAQPEPAWTEQEVRCGPWAFGSSDARFGFGSRRRPWDHRVAAHGHTVSGRLLRIVVIRTHQELAARNPDHVGVRWRARRIRLRGDEWLLIIGTPALQGLPSSRRCRIGEITGSSRDGSHSLRSD
jgi:hypothetical protein